ncbi:hypothetical protein H311_02179 [Anncaliia algerae PRA109]|nr:hypothetical protein H311_02179 [Anncaliia algerae PRA109]
MKYLFGSIFFKLVYSLCLAILSSIYCLYFSNYYYEFKFILNGRNYYREPSRKRKYFNLLTKGTLPEGITALYKTKLDRRSKYFAVHSCLLYFRRNDDVLLRYFANMKKWINF